MSLNLELNRLRGYAILLVVLCHVGTFSFPHLTYQDGFFLHFYVSFLNKIQDFWGGVDLFFVISGYIILKTIITSIDGLNRKSSGPLLANFMKSFYVRRFFRIFPIGVLIWLLVLLREYLLYPHSYQVYETLNTGYPLLTFSFNYYHALQLYTQAALSPYWSLSIEEQFYLLLPTFLILVQTTTKRVWTLVVLLAVITFFIRPYYVVHLGDSLLVDIRYLTQVRCDGLIYGCLIYFLTAMPKIQNFFTTNNKHRIEKIIITSTLVLLIGMIPTVKMISLTLSIPLICILSAILVALAAVEKNIIISFSWLQIFLDYIGLRSYSLYLIHQPVLSTFKIFLDSHQAMANSIWQVAIGLIVCVFISIILAALSYRFIEVPCIRKGRLISSKILASR